MIKIEIENIKLISEKEEYEYVYYLIIDNKILPSGKVDYFGIEVLCKGLTRDYSSIKCVKNFTTSRRYALDIIDYFVENGVSPFHIVDILCDNTKSNFLEEVYL